MASECPLASRSSYWIGWCIGKMSLFYEDSELTFPIGVHTTPISFVSNHIQVASPNRQIDNKHVIKCQTRCPKSAHIISKCLGRVTLANYVCLPNLRRGDATPRFDFSFHFSIFWRRTCGHYIHAGFERGRVRARRKIRFHRIKV